MESIKTNYYWWVLISENDNKKVRELFQLNAENTIQKLLNMMTLKENVFGVLNLVTLFLWLFNKIVFSFQ